MKSFTITDQIREWRNPYYTGNDRIENSSFETNNLDINSTIKPIDREDANAEIEKGEIVQTEDGKLFKALGKRHSNGGTPVKLEKGSFIYSDYKPLSIHKKEKEAFSLKDKGTPAKVLTKEIDIENHNKLIAISQNSHADPLARNSAEAMLTKNFKKLGQLAFIQESKKNFPNGLPKHSQNTGPKLEDDMEYMEQQYQKGGFVKLPKYQAAGIAEPWMRSNTPQGRTTTTNATSTYPYDADRYAKRKQYWENIAGRKFNNLEDLQGFAYSTLERRRPEVIQSMWSKFGPTNKGTDVSGFADNFAGARTGYLLDQDVEAPAPTQYTGLDSSKMPSNYDYLFDNPAAPVAKDEQVKTTPEIDTVLPYSADVRLSGMQKEGLANAALNAASIRRFNPMRVQNTFTPLVMERINAQPSINALDNATNIAYGNNRIMRTPGVMAANSQVRGNYLDRRSQTTGNIRNQNLQISNAENQFNNQGINRTNAQNNLFNNQYYDRVQQVNQNFDRETQTARNKFMSLRNLYQAQNDDLALKLESQKMYTRDMYQSPDGTLLTPEQFEAVKDKSRFKKVRQAAPAMTFDPIKKRVVFNGVNADFNNVDAARDPSEAMWQRLLSKSELSDSETRQLNALAMYMRGRNRQQTN